MDCSFEVETFRIGWAWKLHTYFSAIRKEISGGRLRCWLQN